MIFIFSLDTYVIEDDDENDEFKNNDSLFAKSEVSSSASSFSSLSGHQQQKHHITMRATFAHLKRRPALKDKRLRAKLQRVKHARHFYQRQRTSSAKLSLIDVSHSDSYTKRKESCELLSAAPSFTTNLSLSVSESAATANNNTNLKSYKPSFKVEKLLNDSRGMKKYLIDYDCLMAPAVGGRRLKTTASLNNLSSLADDDGGVVGLLKAAKREPPFTVESLSDCLLKKMKNFERVNEVEEEVEVEEDDDEYDCDEEKKSFSSMSNKCSSGYLSDF